MGWHCVVQMSWNVGLGWLSVLLSCGMLFVCCMSDLASLPFLEGEQVCMRERERERERKRKRKRERERNVWRGAGREDGERDLLNTNVDEKLFVYDGE